MEFFLEWQLRKKKHENQNPEMKQEKAGEAARGILLLPCPARGQRALRNISLGILLTYFYHLVVSCSSDKKMLTK